MVRRQGSAQLMALLLVAALAAACGGSGEPEAAPSPEPATEDATEQTPREATTDAPTSEPTTDAAAESEPAGTAADGEAQFVQELADRLPAEIADAGTMTWVGHVNPPTRIPLEGGGYEGIEIDLAEAVETVLGIEVEHVDGGGLADILLALESARYDFFIGPLKSTQERQESFDFIVWMLTEASFIYSVDLEHPPESADDLCGMSVSIVGAGVLNDFTQGLSDECVERGEEPIDIMEFGDREAGILAVDSGRAQAHGTTQLTALHYQGLQPGTYEIVSKPIGDEPDPLGAVTSKARPELGELMFDVFTELQAQGVYDRVVEEWNVGDAAVDELRWNYAFD